MILKRVGVLLGATGVLLGVLMLSFAHPMLDRGLSAYLSRMLHAKVSVEEVHFSFLNGLFSNRLSVDRKGMYHIEADHLHAVPRIILLSNKPHFRLDVNMQNLIIGQNWTRELLSTDRTNRLEFDTGEASLRLSPESLSLVDGRAMGEDCHVQAEGSLGLQGERLVDLDVSVALSPSIALDIPESLRRNFLGEDTSGFKTFTLAVKGPVNLTSVEIVSDRFRFEAHTRMQ